MPKAFIRRYDKQNVRRSENVMLVLFVVNDTNDLHSFIHVSLFFLGGGGGGGGGFFFRKQFLSQSESRCHAI